MCARRDRTCQQTGTLAPGRIPPVAVMAPGTDVPFGGVAGGAPPLPVLLFLPLPVSSAPLLLWGLPAGLPVPLRAEAEPRLCVLAGEAVAAGFPSPAEDYVEARIDLNRELIASPLSTFFMRVCGDAMRGDGIVDGDLLVIDRSLESRPGRVVVAVHAGRFLVRRLVRRRERLWLEASDGSSSPLLLPVGLEEGGDPELWGVVIHAVHHLSGRRTTGSGGVAP